MRSLLVSVSYKDSVRSRVRIQLLLMVFFSVVSSATCPWLVNRQLFSCMATVSGDFDYVSGGLLERIAFS